MKRYRVRLSKAFYCDVVSQQEGEVVSSSASHVELELSETERQALIAAAGRYAYRGDLAVRNSARAALKRLEGAFMIREGAVAIDSWAGRAYVRCLVVGETPARYRVRWKESRLDKREGEEALVPRGALVTSTKASSPEPIIEEALIVHSTRRRPLLARAKGGAK